MLGILIKKQNEALWKTFVINSIFNVDGSCSVFFSPQGCVINKSTSSSRQMIPPLDSQTRFWSFSPPPPPDRLQPRRQPETHRDRGGTAANHTDHVLTEIAADNYISRQTAEQSIILKRGADSRPDDKKQSNSHVLSQVTQLLQSNVTLQP